MKIANQLEIITKTFAKVERISADHADRLLSLLDKAPAEALEMLVRNRVKFCWMPAVTRLQRTFGYTDSQIEALKA